MEKQNILTPMLVMPAWLQAVESAKIDSAMPTSEDKLRFVIELACKNVQQQTGGPFAAAIFDLRNHKLIAVGVNSVVPAQQSWAHAEMIAFSRAQYKLNRLELKNCILVTSCEPCAMCYGATPWSGVEGLLYGATHRDAERVGFDEGDKIPEWEAALQRRGIKIEGPLLPEESRKPFLLYQKMHGTIY